MANSSNYASLKEAILRRYNISEETYRRQFRATTLKKGETPRELVTRLTDLARKWSKDCSTTEELLDLVVREQFLNSLPEDARTWVRERKAKSSVEAGELAEDFFQAHTTEGHSKTPRERKLPPRNFPRCGLPGHWASDCPKNTTRRDNKPAERAKRQQEVQCFNCKEKGHLSYKCPKTTGLYCDEGDNLPKPAFQEAEIYRSGRVNGITVDDIVLDTGAARTLVWEDLVPPEVIREGEVKIRCAHGDTIIYPLAHINISVGSLPDIVVKAAVSKNLPAAVFLGRDVPELIDPTETHSASPATTSSSSDN